jgi:hypothetical protein
LITETAVPPIIGTDGKRYPLCQLSAAEREFLIDVVHQLRHDQGYRSKASGGLSLSAACLAPMARFRAT